jgi:hypothetical protein
MSYCRLAVPYVGDSGSSTLSLHTYDSRFTSSPPIALSGPSFDKLQKVFL